MIYKIAATLDAIGAIVGCTLAVALLFFAVWCVIKKPMKPPVTAEQDYRAGIAESVAMWRCGRRDQSIRHREWAVERYRLALLKEKP